jgi:hypothetical protein
MATVVPYGKRFRDSLKASKVKLVGLGLAGLSLVASVSAVVDINATIAPIINSVIALIPTIIDLIVAIVPAIIVMAVVGFIVGFLDKILKMMHL